MRLPCPQGGPELAVVDAAGNLSFGTFLPATVVPPLPAIPPQMREQTISWGRYQLDLDAVPTVAVACLTDNAGKSITEITPGSVLKLAVRGVQSESAFIPPLQEGQDPPTDVRGWSIRFDGIPAAILRLDYDTVALIVPKHLTNGSVPMSFWYRGRQEASRIVRVIAPPTN